MATSKYDAKNDASVRNNTRHISAPISARVTRWRADPYAKGAYSYLAKGATPADRTTLAAPAFDQLFFAGEATDRLYPATVHGALQSGRRAAREIIAAGRSSAIVIGGGAAGLAGAEALVKGGLQVTLVEARPRLGGRVWTDHSFEHPIDLGASWIHGVTDNPLTALVEAVGLSTSATDYENYIARDATGAQVNWSQLPRRFVDMVTIEHEYAADYEDLAHQALSENIEFEGGDAILPGGYLQVLESLTGGFDIHLNHPVTRVDIVSNRVEVYAGQALFQAEAALVTVPLGVLKAEDIIFNPPLDRARQNAIARLGMGLLNKVCLLFEDIFWEPDVDILGYTGSPEGYFGEWLNLAKYTGVPILMGFNAASIADALEHRSDDQIIAEAMAALRSMYNSA